MFAYIEGKLVEKNPAYVVLDCNGIGYMINITVNTFVNIKEFEECRLYTHLAIKNEATTPTGFVLYGFSDENERHFFRQLISVSGIGYNTAILILSSLSIDKLYQAIIEKNVALLQTVKGIGAKSAQRIIIDLKDKLEKSKLSSEITKIGYNTNKEAALSGLMILGFSKTGAEKALDKVLQKHGSTIAVEDLIKEALKIL
jgi:Holliday junction DNA helicase RuvA